MSTGGSGSSGGFGPGTGGSGGGGGGGSSTGAPGGMTMQQLLQLLGLGASTTGSALNARASNRIRRIPAAPPMALFPQLQALYTSLVGGSGGLGATSMGTLREMSATGMPVDVGPAFEALVASKKRFTDEGRENIAEMFGASGLRHSSPLATGLVDYESQVSADFMQILSEYTRQSQEAARQRQLAASGMGMEALSAPALGFAPSEHILAGGTSVGGSALQTLGGGLSLMALLSQLFQQGNR